MHLNKNREMKTSLNLTKTIIIVLYKLIYDFSFNKVKRTFKLNLIDLEIFMIVTRKNKTIKKSNFIISKTIFVEINEKIIEV